MHGALAKHTSARQSSTCRTNTAARPIRTWISLSALLVAAGITPSTLRAEHGEPITAALMATTGGRESSNVVPNRWLPSKGLECERRGRYRGMCAGPRRTPEPFGEAAERSAELGLGTKKTVSQVFTGMPKPEWLQAAGEIQEDALLWPIEGSHLGRGFGRTRNGAMRHRNHNGIDIGAPEGTPVRAVQSGLVLYSDNGVRGYGNLLVVAHPDGSVAMYAHCRALYVFPGQVIERGQLVGEVGHTGYARGPHLHFEYRERGRLRDPMRRFAR